MSDDWALSSNTVDFRNEERRARWRLEGETIAAVSPSSEAAQERGNRGRSGQPAPATHSSASLDSLGKGLGPDEGLLTDSPSWALGSPSLAPSSPLPNEEEE